MSVENLIISKLILAPIEHVYRAFTNSTAYREWMCDVCIADPRPLGRLYFGWNGPFYAAGEFTQVELYRLVAFSWQGRGEPAPTWVKVTLNPAEDGTSLRLEHGGLGEGAAWERARQTFQRSWETGLENLASVLETGRDLRIVNKPMLGVYLDAFDPEIARRIGVPVTQGARLGGVLDGLGAQQAGLQENDVIVRLNGRVIRDVGDLGAALQPARAGDDVEVDYYRKTEQRTARFKLAGRPIPEIPPTAAALSEAVEQIYGDIKPTLDALFQGVSEAQAGHQPAENEWSAKEVLAHLIHSERGLQNAIVEAVGSAEAHYDQYAGNWNGRNHATLSAMPSLVALLREYRTLMDETVVLFAELPPEFVSRKSSYWRLVFNSMQLASHFNSHALQIKAALESAPAIYR